MARSESNIVEAARSLTGCLLCLLAPRPPLSLPLLARTMRTAAVR